MSPDLKDLAVSAAMQLFDEAKQLANDNAGKAQSLQWKLDLLRKAIADLADKWDREETVGPFNVSRVHHEELRALLKEQP